MVVLRAVRGQASEHVALNRVREARPPEDPPVQRAMKGRRERRYPSIAARYRRTRFRPDDSRSRASSAPVQCPTVARQRCPRPVWDPAMSSAQETLVHPHAHDACVNDLGVRSAVEVLVGTELSVPTTVGSPARQPPWLASSPSSTTRRRRSVAEVASWPTRATHRRITCSSTRVAAPAPTPRQPVGAIGSARRCPASRRRSPPAM